MVAARRQFVREPNRRMQLEVFPSPGGYICGEQTAARLKRWKSKRGQNLHRPRPNFDDHVLSESAPLLVHCRNVRLGS